MFKVEQKVWCAMFGEGEVMKIITNNTCYPVEVSFGGSIPEFYTLDGKFHSWANQTLFPYPVEIIKKVAKPSINWEHVDSKFNYLAEDANGDAFLYEKEPFSTTTAFCNGGGGFQSPEHYRTASMTAIAIIVAALLGHDISKAIDLLTDVIERNKQENQK